MEPVIDVHTHLGDILYPGGGSLIEKKGVRKARIFDPISISEVLLHRDFGGGDTLYRLMGRWVTRAERARNFTATGKTAGSPWTRPGSPTVHACPSHPT
jgi:hypothetical protein